MIDTPSSINSLARIQSAWKHAPHELLSLWDMIESNLGRLHATLEDLDYLQNKAIDAAKLNPGVQAAAWLCESTDGHLTKIYNAVQVLQLSETDGRRAGLSRRILGLVDYPACTNEIIASEIEALLHAFWFELAGRKFAFIRPENLPFFEKPDLFGEKIFTTASKELNSHIKDAGNCIAADLNTAAVFHLMCVVEHGLRALAAHLKVKTVKKSLPIELGTWEDIIKALEARVKLLQSHPNSVKRGKDLDFYNEVSFEFRQFKDFWRNKVAHTRATYDHNQALSAFNHVRAFIQRLSERVPLK